ncbi:MAG: hypothetical protein V4671_16810, partial [Armatimonadota bacterium]
MIIATDAAIQTAIRNEATMTGYEITEFEMVPGNFYVHTPQGEDYTVKIRPGVENVSPSIRRTIGG